jgi:hypothetical protein
VRARRLRLPSWCLSRRRGRDSGRRALPALEALTDGAGARSAHPRARDARSGRRRGRRCGAAPTRRARAGCACRPRRTCWASGAWSSGCTRRAAYAGGATRTAHTGGPGRARSARRAARGARHAGRARHAARTRGAGRTGRAASTGGAARAAATRGARAARRARAARAGACRPAGAGSLSARDTRQEQRCDRNRKSGSPDHCCLLGFSKLITANSKTCARRRPREAFRFRTPTTFAAYFYRAEALTGVCEIRSRRNFAHSRCIPMDVERARRLLDS